jgi:transcriptional regulator with XRE-family HTH domain
LTESVNATDYDGGVAGHRTDELFGDAVRQLVAERGITLRSVAAQIGVDPGFFIRVLQGKQPLSAKVLVGVTDAFELPRDYFVEARRETISKLLSESVSFVDEIYDHVNPDIAKPAVDPVDLALEEAGIVKGDPRGPGIDLGARIAKPAPQGPRSSWISPVTVLRAADPADTELARLAAAVFARYERDDIFHRAVEEERPEMERLAQRLDELRVQSEGDERIARHLAVLRERSRELEAEVAYWRERRLTEGDEDREAIERRLSDLEAQERSITAAIAKLQDLLAGPTQGRAGP